MTTLLAGVGPAGRGVLTAMMVEGRLPGICADGLVVLDADDVPGGGALSDYNVRSDSAAIVFAQCVTTLQHEPELRASAALATILGLPDGESVALSVVGQLLSESTTAVLRQAQRLGADLRLGCRLTGVRPRPEGGASVTLRGADGVLTTAEFSHVILATGGQPWVPPELQGPSSLEVRHSDEILRPAGLRSALDRLPAQPRVVVIGRAHSAFSVADRLLASETSLTWGPAAVTVATRGGVRVTYPDPESARIDGAVFTEDDVCPQSRRVWRLCGLRGDSADRYRMGRDGVDPRLRIEEIGSRSLVDVVGGADLVVAATGYRTSAHRLFDQPLTTRPDGTLVDESGRPLPGIRTIGLGSGSRRSELAGGEPSYTGPVDGVWHYQTALAPPMLADLYGVDGDRHAGTAVLEPVGA